MTPNLSISPDHISRDFDLLYPPFAKKIQQGIERARVGGYDLMLFEGWRSPQRQSFLYAQGRSAPGKIVTQSDAWESWHQYGVASDIVFDVNGEPSWAGDFGIISDFFTSLGLRWLGSIGDRPHYEVAVPFDIKFAQSLARNSGMQALWAQLGK